MPKNLWKVTFCTPSHSEYGQPSGQPAKFYPCPDVRSWATKGKATQYARRMLEDYPAIAHAYTWGYDSNGLWECSLVKL